MSDEQITNGGTTVFNLGECRYESPLRIPQFIEEGSGILYDVRLEDLQSSLRAKKEIVAFENAGPRKRIYFNPSETTAAIVTCGGICPGINDVIKSLVVELIDQYGVKRVLGIRYGYEGLIPDYGHRPMELTPLSVSTITHRGGTLLGTSRGLQDPERMVDTLVQNNIDILFTIGGDGTLRGAAAIFDVIRKRDLKISVIGIPKTIDNDIDLIDRTFGFETAVAEATKAVQSAYAEATSFRNGIGLVRVMGRDSGFIAAFAALASNVADFVLVPEVPFVLRGESGLLNRIHAKFTEKRYAVIVVAEGAGQEFFGGGGAVGSQTVNREFGNIGHLLKDEISGYFRELDVPINMKYIDPSYIIRSVEASADDAVFCLMLAQNAVHGGMSGKSGIMVGKWNSFFTFVPIGLAVRKRKRIDPNGYLWSIVREATGQGDLI
jgi:6-phosphofructokinase 1